MTTTKELTAYDLRRDVDQWFNQTFNTIQLDVYERMADNCLYDYIQSPNLDLQEYFNYTLGMDERAEIIVDYIYNEFQEFEFKSDKVKTAFALYVLNESTDIEELEGLIFDSLPCGRVTGIELAEHALEYCEENFSSFDEYNESQSSDNYPIWNTLFEFRSSAPSEWLEKAKSVGLGVINEFDSFNDTLFATSAGHSFYSAYWIPLYLSIFESEAIKYAGIDYSGQ